jgi:hypothetical protein
MPTRFSLCGIICRNAERYQKRSVVVYDFFPLRAAFFTGVRPPTSVAGAAGISFRRLLYFANFPRSEAGIQIEESAEQPANTEGPTDRASWESAVNVTVARAVQSAKHRSRSFLTVEGMQIDESDLHAQKAQSSIRESLEPGSNVTLQRDRQESKQ